MSSPGRPYPLGSSVDPHGVNFSVYSAHATAVALLLFDHAEDATPSAVYELDRGRNETVNYWHIHVEGVGAGQLYGWRCDGSDAGFDGAALLLDPYGRAVANTARYDRQHRGTGYGSSLKSVVVDDQYDWGEDQPPRRPLSQTVIYELHVGGFTRHPSSGVGDAAGTYRGLIEKIDYLLDLGVTAVELLPVFQFDPHDAPDGLTNYWGYSPISFFAPHGAYSSAGDGLAALDEFRDMVKALHAVGIEVILDVVYNHTAEGDERGPTLSLRGLDRPTYYLLDDDGSYANYSGCGNTINANAAVTRRLILDSLRYWVQEMHVDGFRFDLAAIFARDSNGEPMRNPPLLWDIETDPVLAGRKLIAEAWDAAGLYQVGEFFGHHFKEWNGRFRDDVRGFFRGDRATVRNLAQRLIGSPDIYQSQQAERSVNYVTSHDGFTLNDLVTYSHKDNFANGEENRDGDNHNLSWNCGFEGPSRDPGITRLRERQIRNFFTVTLLSVGAPMILMGDEIRRTQRGNNNAYCQDNELSWFDWTQVAPHDPLRRFVRELIALRKSLVMHQDNDDRTLAELLSTAHLIRWHGVRLGEPDWADYSHSLALEVHGARGALYIALNAYIEPLDFEVPELAWRKLIDTNAAAPHDITPQSNAPYATSPCRVHAHSVVVLTAKRGH